ncbi:hypothetical protein BDW68DRAFT_178820 [Aspergillus falconensis]
MSGATAKERKAKLESPQKTDKEEGPDPFDAKPRTAKTESIGASHRLYKADDLTTYSATLIRPSDSAQGIRRTVQLKIYETIEVPHRYATHIRLSCGRPAKTKFLAPGKRSRYCLDRV